MLRFRLTLSALLLMMAYTCFKLYKMYQIERAFEKSAYKRVLTYKWIQPEGKRTFYMITWAKDNDRIGDFEEDNLEYEDWKALNVGDTLEVVKMYGDAFTRKSVYIEQGNFAFDFGFLGLEIFMIGMLIWKRERLYRVIDKIMGFK